MKAWIFGGIGIVLVLLVGLGTGLFLAGALDANGVTDEEVPQSGEEEGPGEAHYFNLEPAFVVNVNDGQRSRFLQIEVQLMTRDEEVLEALERHTPAIRNRLLLLFTDLDPERVQHREGREALQEAARDQVIETLEAEGEPDELESVMFTSFVMQ